MRAVSVAFSPERPSRLKNEPGILPAEYMRSSTSTVSGRKSTSRWPPAVAVERTIVSPWRTTTAPEACLAILPVSNEISSPAISTDTRVTVLLLITSLPSSSTLRSVEPFSFLLVPNSRQLSGPPLDLSFGGHRLPCQEDRLTGPRPTSSQMFFKPPRIMWTGGRSAGEGA